jgi:hypothetical protein
MDELEELGGEWPDIHALFSHYNGAAVCSRKGSEPLQGCCPEPLRRGGTLTRATRTLLAPADLYFHGALVTTTVSWSSGRMTM